MRRKAIRQLLNELRDHVERGVPHDLHFKPTAGLTDEQVERLQLSLDCSFETWRQTWIFPWIDALEQATKVNELKR